MFDISRTGKEMLDLQDKLAERYKCIQKGLSINGLLQEIEVIVSYISSKKVLHMLIISRISGILAHSKYAH